MLLFCRVKLEGQPPTTLQIIGNVVERSLELLTLDTEDTVQTINFGSTYYGTDLAKSFLIYNNGPDVANFVVILEEGGEGQEAVCIASCRPVAFSVQTFFGLVTCSSPTSGSLRRSVASPKNLCMGG